jgi:hypothetical protein
VISYKKAVVQMYDDHSVFEKDRDFQDFLRRVKGREIKKIRELDVDLDPILQFFSGQGSLSTMPMKQLTERLCWMLTVVGMLRPDSILCIDLSSTDFKITDDFAVLPIHGPKEKRGGQSISWCLTVRRHDNPLLCPVATIAEYCSRIKEHPCSVPHHKNPNIMYTPLVRSCKDLSVPVTRDSISNHAAVVEVKLDLPPGVKRIRGRAMGSTAAFQAGAPVGDIVAYANWSSSILFDKYYRLGSRTATNFTTTILRPK